MKLGSAMVPNVAFVTVADERMAPSSVWGNNSQGTVVKGQRLHAPTVTCASLILRNVVKPFA